MHYQSQGGTEVLLQKVRGEEAQDLQRNTYLMALLLPAPGSQKALRDLHRAVKERSGAKGKGTDRQGNTIRPLCDLTNPEPSRAFVIRRAP